MEAQERERPLAGVIRTAPDGTHYLQGWQCSACGEVLVATHRACPSCAAQGTLSALRLAEHGRLYTYTIVHRSFPGVVTPIVSAIVRLDGGGFLKGNLVGVPPDPAAIAFDMPVSVAFEALPAPDGGGPLVRYVFKPEPSRPASEKAANA